MRERLQKILAARSGLSRRAAEKIIEAGRVTVNGVTAHLGDGADPDLDEVCLDGAPLGPAPERKVYIMLNKPVGYVTTMHDERGRRTVAELVSDLPVRVYPVGRLDINSEGLLLMTNDGDLANRLTHPSFEKEKTYRVLVTGDAQAGLRRLREPMELDGVRLRRPRVRLLGTEGPVSTLDITIHEGRNRQIRRMCELAGLTVKRLTRVSEGGIRLNGLKKGAWRELTPAEARTLLGEDLQENKE